MKMKYLCLISLVTASNGVVGDTFNLPANGLTLNSSGVDSLSRQAYSNRSETFKTSSELNLMELDSRLNAIDGKKTYDLTKISVETTLETTLSRIKSFIGQLDSNTNLIDNVDGNGTVQLKLEDYISNNNAVTGAALAASNAQGAADSAASSASSAMSAINDLGDTYATHDDISNSAERICADLNGEWQELVEKTYYKSGSSSKDYYSVNGGGVSVAWSQSDIGYKYCENNSGNNGASIRWGKFTSSPSLPKTYSTNVVNASYYRSHQSMSYNNRCIYRINSNAGFSASPPSGSFPLKYSGASESINIPSRLGQDESGLPTGYYFPSSATLLSSRFYAEQNSRTKIDYHGEWTVRSPAHCKVN